MPDLLLEFFCEEIPARMQKNAAENLRKTLTDALVEAGLTYEGAVAYWTPRRLILDLRGLDAHSKDISQERKGPRTDAPQKAIDGFLRGAGLSSIDEAEIRTDPKKGDYYIAVIHNPGREAAEIIAQTLPTIIKSFSWPKSMRWGEGSRHLGSLTWVRPLQSILCTFGPETEDPKTISFSIGDITASNETFGHRFMSPGPIIAKHADDYIAALEKAYVMVDAGRREQTIKTDAENLAFAQGFEVIEDSALLSEVAGLVEWPHVLMGEFQSEFLEIPDRVIQLTIKENQKCFVVRDPKSQSLTNKFVMVANIVPTDGGKEVARGNAKVVNARLADAKFFWESDLHQIKSEEGFTPWVDKLHQVTFHAKLGSLGERVERIQALAKTLAPLTGANIDLCMRAALLCKADLNSAMVYEFPEVQGFMGRIYAEIAGEDPSVAMAIEDHYKPLGPTEDVPHNLVAITIALADKLDSLIGFWAIDEKPTGSKDPYALRRAALGVIRLILENKLEFGLTALGTNMDLLSFFHDRLKVYLRDKGIRHDVMDAVIKPDSDDMLAIVQKAEALQPLLDTDDGKNLLAGIKRAGNILTAEEKKGAEIASAIDTGLFATPEEKTLADALDHTEQTASACLQKRDYKAAMTTLASLRAPIDAFFEQVMVNDEDEAIRANRLSLLGRVRNVIHPIADLSKISGS